MRSMLSVASLAALVACCFAAVAPNVLRFEMESETGQVGTYVFTNCLPAAQETLVVNSLVFSPDPLVFPGPLNVAFDLTVKSQVDSPLKASVYLGRKIGSNYIKIPCIGNIGSCTYDDICQLLEQITECPEPFTSAGIPCKCPFKTGSYKLPQASFDVNSALLPPGNYHGQANLTMSNVVVGCYDIKATFG